MRELREDSLHLGDDAANDGEMLVRRGETGECMEEVGDPFGQVDAADIEDLEAVLGRVGDLLEAVEQDAVGQDVDFFGRNAAIEVGLARVGGGDGDGVGCLVDGLFADEVMGVVVGVFFDAPA